MKHILFFIICTLFLASSCTKEKTPFVQTPTCSENVSFVNDVLPVIEQNCSGCHDANGAGGYSFTEVYELPIHMRKYIFHQIKEHYEKQNKQNENPEELAKKIKNGQVEVPDYAKGKKLSYG